MPWANRDFWRTKIRTGSKPVPTNITVVVPSAGCDKHHSPPRNKIMENPLFKKLPKIGIRPAIDGRLGGVRESLEVQTMNLAKSVARLIGERLRYPNGKAVQCVIADRCIGGVAEAAACAEKFAGEGTGLSFTVP